MSVFRPGVFLKRLRQVGSCLKSCSPGTGAGPHRRMRRSSSSRSLNPAGGAGQAPGYGERSAGVGRTTQITCNEPLARHAFFMSHALQAFAQPLEDALHGPLGAADLGTDLGNGGTLEA